MGNCFTQNTRCNISPINCPIKEIKQTEIKQIIRHCEHIKINKHVTGWTIKSQSFKR